MTGVRSGEGSRPREPRHHGPHRQLYRSRHSSERRLYTLRPCSANTAPRTPVNPCGAVARSAHRRCPPAISPVTGRRLGESGEHYHQTRFRSTAGDHTNTHLRLLRKSEHAVREVRIVDHEMRAPLADMAAVVVIKNLCRRHHVGHGRSGREAILARGESAREVNLYVFLRSTEMTEIVSPELERHHGNSRLGIITMRLDAHVPASIHHARNVGTSSVSYCITSVGQHKNASFGRDRQWGGAARKAHLFGDRKHRPWAGAGRCGLALRLLAEGNVGGGSKGGEKQGHRYDHRVLEGSPE